jgi:hypothetical protein
MKYVFITSIAGLGLLIPAAIGLGLFLSGSPTLLSPLPALTVIPALLLSSQNYPANAAVMLPTFLFLLWNPQLFRGEGKVPRRSHLLLALLAALTVIDFIASWKLGAKYQGLDFTAAVCAINVAWLALLGFGFAKTVKRTTSFATSLFLHWMLVAWLCWYAFPWLGELI